MNNYKLFLCTIINLLLSFHGQSIEATTKREVFSRYPNKYFIETGSLNGEGIQMALDAGFECIYSIELSPYYYTHCCNRFASSPNVNILLGDSAEVLAELLKKIETSATFWLDGHYTLEPNAARAEMNCPIYAELEHIRKHPVKNHTLLIDDVRLFGTVHFDYIELNEIIQKIFEINPNYQIKYEDGFIPNDVLVAYIPVETPPRFVSFIMPCYNCEKTMEESIASIYKQNLNVPFELICTDDCSTDRTREILEACARAYPNLFIYSHALNKGGGATRNTCVSHARGDLIFCLDSDNVLIPNSVQGLVDLIDHTGCDIAVFDDVKFFIDDYKQIHAYKYSIGGDKILDLVSFITAQPNYNPAYSGNYLFTRKSYNRAGGYLENYGALDTTAFGLAQLATGSKMILLPNQFYWHRQGIQSYFIRELEKNDANFLKLLNDFSWVFSDESNIWLQNQLSKMTQSTFNKFTSGGLTPASAAVLESLYRAYAYKAQKDYPNAANEFDSAIKFGCKDVKIHMMREDMLELAKIPCANRL